MAPADSQLRAVVHWRQPTIYSGEEIECIITFKNVAAVPRSRSENGESAESPSTNGPAHSRRASYLQSAPHSRKSSIAQVKPPPLLRAPSATSIKGGRGHRPAMSLSVVAAPSRGGLSSAPLQQGGTPNSAVKPGNGHARSLSIISLGSEPASESRTATSASVASKRPAKVHARSVSMQQPRMLMAHSPASTSMPSPRQPSPLYEANTPPALPDSQQIPLRPARRRPGTVSADHTPQLGSKPSLEKRNGHFGGNSTLSNFKFPPVQAHENGMRANTEQVPKVTRTPLTMHSGQQKRSLSPRPAEGWSVLNPISRVMSETSTEGTPRTSSELYSISNKSDETLTSELPLQQQLGRLLPKGVHSRQPSRPPQTRPAEPETLMMAYAQTMGHFTLDGSLINAAPFEEVKRKGVQGGGGVVGVERSKRSSGLFGALSWGNIGESLGGLIGGDEMSSMAQMKASVGSRTIPLLSTPQSLLFVDLRLAPGESKSYKYRFSLPRGLPPSHRGRAIKVAYNLCLGIQRPGGQAVEKIDIPFRVLGSYDSRGDTLGHDLMSPYVLLQDNARTTSIVADPTSPADCSLFSTKTTEKKKTPQQGLEDFLRYTERLTDSPGDVSGVLLSPTSPNSPASPHNVLSRQSSVRDLTPTNAKEAIDFAILRSNLVNQSGKTPEAQSANRFNIARSGQPVAVLTLLRPAYRLGEAVTGVIDFTAPISSSRTASVPTYSVLIELETSEQVDQSLALRSSHSIHRVTRKVYASIRECSLFARHVSFNLAIPASATPTFETSGVSLAWRLRVEFTTQRQVQGLRIEGSNTGEDLLEELSTDERGTMLIAKERLLADTFEIAVPLKVFGAVGIDAMSAESDSLIV